MYHGLIEEFSAQLYLLNSYKKSWYRVYKIKKNDIINIFCFDKGAKETRIIFLLHWNFLL